MTNITRYKIYIISMPEGEGKENEMAEIIGVIMFKNISKLMTGTKPQIQIQEAREHGAE